MKQWHNQPGDEAGGFRLGDYFDGFVDGECQALGVTRAELRAWRPEGTGEKRERVKREKAAATGAGGGSEGAAARPGAKRPKKKSASTEPVEGE